MACHQNLPYFKMAVILSKCGTLCTLHLKLIVVFYYDRYEVPPVILVLIPLTNWSTWSNSPWMTDLIS